MAVKLAILCLTFLSALVLVSKKLLQSWLCLTDSFWVHPMHFFPSYQIKPLLAVHRLQEAISARSWTASLHTSSIPKNANAPVLRGVARGHTSTAKISASASAQSLGNVLITSNGMMIPAGVSAARKSAQRLNFSIRKDVFAGAQRKLLHVNAHRFLTGQPAHASAPPGTKSAPYQKSTIKNAGAYAPGS